MPKRFEEHEKKRIDKLEKIKKLKPHEVDPECKFAPEINKLPPKNK
jgi:hypothetical protein